MLSQDFKEFVELLNKNKVEYLIVGGYAVGIYGYPRYTGDLDVWIKPNLENAEKMVTVMQDFGFASLRLTTEDFMTEGNVIQMGYPPFRIDVLTRIDGVIFDHCYPNKKIVEYEDLKINFIGFDDLKNNKRASGRSKDTDDLENLE